jgi:hypothetical protein
VVGLIAEQVLSSASRRKIRITIPLTMIVKRLAEICAMGDRRMTYIYYDVNLRDVYGRLLVDELVCVLM